MKCLVLLPEAGTHAADTPDTRPAVRSTAVFSHPINGRRHGRRMSRAESIDETNPEQGGLRPAKALGFAVTSFERIVRIERQVRRHEEIADLLNEGENEAHGNSRLNASRVIP